MLYIHINIYVLGGGDTHIFQISQSEICNMASIFFIFFKIKQLSVYSFLQQMQAVLASVISIANCKGFLCVSLLLFDNS